MEGSGRGVNKGTIPAFA